MPGPVEQIVITRLRDPAERERFLDVTRSMVAWLREQTGFLGYELFEGEHGEWSDRLSWASREDAERVTRAFVETPVGREMLDLVAPGYRYIMGVRVDL